MAICYQKALDFGEILVKRLRSKMLVNINFLLKVLELCVVAIFY